MMKELWKYITTGHVLVIQHDGFPINAEAWDDEFLGFDYTGAPWLYPDSERCVGNGGCSIRSRNLLYTLGNDDFIKITEQEDDAISRLYGAYLEDTYGMEFAPVSLAEKFAFELREPCAPTFAFHQYFHHPFKEHVVIKRSGAMGDIILSEPLIDYYSKKGFQVVMDIPEGEMKLFIQYPHFVKHISQMNSKIVPYKTVNLDMAYEVTPKRRVLESYYEMAGITDGEIRNSRLYIYQEPHQRLFKKYILIHNDEVGLPHRNSYSANWAFVVGYYERLGYTILQVGNNPREQVATHFNCPTKDMLMYLCKGADLVIGLDSGVAQLSVALGTPTVIMSGSVNLQLRYVNFEKIGVVQGKCPSEEDKNCYHNSITTVGSKCKYDENTPPCSQHSEHQIIKEANKLLKLN
jgi:hypothetical protein